MSKERLEKQLFTAKSWIVISAISLIILFFFHLLPILISGKDFMTYVVDFINEDNARWDIPEASGYTIHLTISPILFIMFLIYLIYGIRKYCVVKKKIKSIKD